MLDNELESSNNCYALICFYCERGINTAKIGKKNLVLVRKHERGFLFFTDAILSYLQRRKTNC